jgi:hypothetical protein
MLQMKRTKTHLEIIYSGHTYISVVEATVLHQNV